MLIPSGGGVTFKVIISVYVDKRKCGVVSTQCE